MKKPVVLIVDDDASMRILAVEVATDKGFEVIEAHNVNSGIEAFRDNDVDLILTDLRMPDGDGTDVVKYVKETNPIVEVIILTGEASVENAVEAMKAGAYDLMEKPYNIEELSLNIDNALEKKLIAQDRDIMSNKLALLEMTRTITSTIEYHTLLDRTIEIIFTTLKADSCSLMGYNETENVLRIEAAIGLPEKVIKETVIKPGERVAGWVLKTKQSVLLIDKVEDEAYRQFKGKKNIGSAISTLIQTQGHIHGVLNVSRKKSNNPFNVTDKELVEIFSSEVAIAMENAKLYKELQLKMGNLDEAYKQLIQSEKLSSLGLLAGSIAHDINNPLAVISGRVQLMKGKIEDESVKKNINIIGEQAKRIQELVQGLRSYTRNDSKDFGPVAIKNCFEQVFILTEKYIKEYDVTVSLTIEKDIPPLYGHKNQIEQVLMNVVQNAVQATKNEDKRKVDITAVCDNNHGVITISDNGPGVSAEDAQKIFDPLFTTKGEKEGTGLGLSICKRIVNKHNGTIALENLNDGGASFIISLPLVSEKEEKN